MARIGKIARLPEQTREELNRRLADGEEGVQLLDWLNGLPEVQQTVAAGFDGLPINKQNLSDWRRGGFVDWQERTSGLWTAERVKAEAEKLSAVTAGAEGSFADMLALVLESRYAGLVVGSGGEPDKKIEGRLRRMKSLCQDVVRLRRGDHTRERLRLANRRFEHKAREEREKALDGCMEEAKEFPQVQEVIRFAFRLLERGQSGKLKGDKHVDIETAWKLALGLEEEEARARLAEQEAERRKPWLAYGGQHETYVTDMMTGKPPVLGEGSCKRCTQKELDRAVAKHGKRYTGRIVSKEQSEAWDAANGGSSASGAGEAGEGKDTFEGENENEEDGVREAPGQG